MKANVGKAVGSQKTPAETMMEYVIEHIMALMTMGGIESISVQKFVTGMGSRLHTLVGLFKDAPEEIKVQGVVMKDALAQIMSVANITKIEAKLTGEEMAEARRAWGDAVKKCSRKDEIDVPLAKGDTKSAAKKKPNKPAKNAKARKPPKAKGAK